MTAAANMDTVTRDYPILVSARGDLEGECLWKLRNLQNSEQLWTVLRPCKLTNRVRALAFKMINRAIVKVARGIACDGVVVMAVWSDCGWEVLRYVVDAKAEARTSPAWPNGFPSGGRTYMLVVQATNTMRTTYYVFFLLVALAFAVQLVAARLNSHHTVMNSVCTC